MERATLAAVGGVILVSLMFVGLGERGHTPAPEEAPVDAPAEAPPLAPSSPQVPPRIRTPIPRPPGATARPGAARIPKAEANAAVSAVFRDEALRSGLLDCLEHIEVPEKFDGMLTLEFHFDGGGLADSNILDVPGVPQPLVDCLGAAVWTGPWPQITDGEVDAAWPIHLSTE